MQRQSFFKTLTQMTLKFLPLAVVIWFIVAWFELPRIASWGFAGVVMMYAFLLSLPPKKKTEITNERTNIQIKLKQNYIRKQTNEKQPQNICF